MSSYHGSFTYKNINSKNDKNLMVVAFDPDNGFSDTFLSMEPIFTESTYGTQRLDYGARYNSVATFSITVIKDDCSDFTRDENRDLLKWLTGARTNSWLDLYNGEEIDYSFFCRVTNVQQRKIDSRVIGLKIEFTSIHPWAWSQVKNFGCSVGEGSINIDKNDGTIYKDKNGDTYIYYGIDDDGFLYNYSNDDDVTFGVDFSIDDDGFIYSDSAVTLEGDEIYNETDELYSYTYLNMEYQSQGSSELTILNEILHGDKKTEAVSKTEIKNIGQSEKITISDNQFIVSDNGRIFGDDFNFVWPRLLPGENKFTISSSGKGLLKFGYRYPIKIGDCAMDILEIAEASCEYCTVDKFKLIKMLEAVLSDEN